MFISKKEYESLINRIETLEKNTIVERTGFLGNNIDLKKLSQIVEGMLMTETMLKDEKTQKFLKHVNRR
jgi:hypothetical protein